MAEPAKPVGAEEARDLSEKLVSEDLLFSRYLQEEDRPALRKAFIIAILFHAFAISITIPEFPDIALPQAKKTIITVRRWRPPPPPRKQQPERPKVEKIVTKKVPIPDPTPEEPEPIVEPEPETEEYVDIPLDAEILIGAPEAPPATDGILFAGVGGVTNPEKIHDVQPDYPEIARKAGIEGQVVLQAVVLADGTVAEVAVLKSPGAKFGFDDEAIKAVKQWRYKPALQAGKPVDVYFTVVVNFYLQD